jgi:predicted ester cyclase
MSGGRLLPSVLIRPIKDRETIYYWRIPVNNPSIHHGALPLSREHMPTDYYISLDRYFQRENIGQGYYSEEQRIPSYFGPDQSMRGFEAIYPNIIDYIVRITYQIWEERDVEYIGSTYSDDSKVFDDYGLQFGNKKIIADTHHTTAAFSNIRLIADEVVWAGNDDIGYHTSHRTIIRGRNDGDSKYGAATGKDVDVLVIANCVAKDNKIFLEHVLYNNSSLVLQLGLDLSAMAEKMVLESPAGWPRSEETWTRLRGASSPEMPISVSEPIDGFDVDAFSRANFNTLWNENNFAAMEDVYFDGFQFFGPSDRVFSGQGAYQDFVESMCATFPDLQLQVDEVYWMGNEAEGYISSVRWSATGTHQGDVLYPNPQGCEVQIWGITQQKIRGGKVKTEWTLFNELDLMMQLAAHRNALNET